MFSIIVCSIDPQKAENLKRNIKDTASMPFEVLIFDNRNVGLGLCAVYNKMAGQAKYDNLLFIHEDIIFHGKGWDAILAEKFTELIARKLHLPCFDAIKLALGKRSFFSCLGCVG